MQIIATHRNADFDAIACLVAAKKLYPHAVVALPDLQQPDVKGFLNLYRDSFPFTEYAMVAWERVTHLILVDTASIRRIGPSTSTLKDSKVTIFDHHPPFKQTTDNEHVIEPTGACITLLIEALQQKKVSITSIEATLFGLGLYTDTGSFTHSTTSLRDLQAAMYVMEQGMNIEIINQFSDPPFSQEQQDLFSSLLSDGEYVDTEGLRYFLASASLSHNQRGLAIIGGRLLDVVGADAVLLLVHMQNKVFITGRASSNRIDLLPLMEKYGGGGHEQAASAMIEDKGLQKIKRDVISQIELTKKPTKTAKQMMSSPVKSVPSSMTITETRETIIRFGHTGFPVMDGEKLVGIISRRDVDKAIHHGFGHAPVKGYMSRDPHTITADATLEDIQQQMIQHNIGRLPVIENEKVIGIVTRTNVIERLHQPDETKRAQNEHQLLTAMKKHLSANVYSLLLHMGELATKQRVNAYLIGGIVRDLVLQRRNEDVDIVIEGDGLSFAESLALAYEGEVKKHPTFATATVTFPDGFKVDVTSSRTEYYEKPGALPTVKTSFVKEDLSRRDFSMNAMAIQINPDKFGRLLDPFHGWDDIQHKRLRVLHNLSFVEDPTRILRGVRFEKRLGFHMDETTERLISTSKSSISSLSKDRIMTEFRQLFLETDPYETLERLNELDTLDAFLPDTTWGEIERRLIHTYTSQISKEENQAFASNRDKWFFPILLLYGSDPSRINDVYALTTNKPQTHLIKQCAMVFFERRVQPDTALGDVHTLFDSIDDESLFLGEIRLEACKQTDTAKKLYNYRIKRKSLPIWITGVDLKKLGLTPGPQYKDWLFRVEQETLNGNIGSKDEAITFVKQVLQHMTEK